MSYKIKDCTVVTFDDEPGLRVFFYYTIQRKYRAEVYWQDSLYWVQEYSTDRQFSKIVKRVERAAKLMLRNSRKCEKVPL